MSTHLRQLTVRALGAATRPSTPAHLREAIEKALTQLRADALEAALAAAEEFRHIAVSADGEVVGLSMYVRGLLDSASCASSNPAFSAAELTAIDEASGRVTAGDEAAIADLERALRRR